MEAIKNQVQNVLNDDHHNSNSENGKTILITGGSGFVAANVLNAFLSRGYNVRTTVRSQETAEKVKKSHAKYLSQLTFAIVPDVATPGGHDEAVKGVDGVSFNLPSRMMNERLTVIAGNSHSVPLCNKRRKQRTRPPQSRHSRHNLPPNFNSKVRPSRNTRCPHLLLRLHRRLV